MMNIAICESCGVPRDIHGSHCERDTDEGYGYWTNDGSFHVGKKPALHFTPAELARMQRVCRVGLEMGRAWRDFETVLHYLTCPCDPNNSDDRAMCVGIAAEAHARMIRDWPAGGTS